MAYFALADDIDPTYARTFAEAHAAGVEALAVSSEVTFEACRCRAQFRSRCRLRQNDERSD
jgi:DNA-binding sugar fermentation-stimulating protein